MNRAPRLVTAAALLALLAGAGVPAGLAAWNDSATARHELSELQRLSELDPAEALTTRDRVLATYTLRDDAATLRALSSAAAAAGLNLTAHSAIARDAGELVEIDWVLRLEADDPTQVTSRAGTLVAALDAAQVQIRANRLQSAAGSAALEVTTTHAR